MKKVNTNNEMTLVTMGNVTYSKFHENGVNTWKDNTSIFKSIFMSTLGVLQYLYVIIILLTSNTF